jgi:nicotinamidase/pyrazinamidase
MRPTSALLVIDVQNDFCPGGALAVADGDAIVPFINRLAKKFETVVVTQDWHPADHISFAAQHPGKSPFEQITLPYGEQTLWPTHCVMATKGAALHPALDIPHAGLIIRKGSHREVDSYSAFLEADRRTRTGLDGYFASRGVTDVYVCGLATDFCVAWSAEDAVRFGLKASVIEDACRAIDLEGSLAQAISRLDEAGVRRLRSEVVLS